MNKIKQAPLLVVSLLILASCELNKPTESSNNVSSEISSYELRSFNVETTTSIFYQYDLIDYSSFQIEDGENGEIISKFKIYDGEKELLNKENRLLSFGKLLLTFKVDGYDDTSYEISIKRSSNFSESLSIEKVPEKTEYSNGEIFQKDGLKILKTLSYTRSDQKSVLIKEECSDYKITIDGLDMDQYVFNEERFAIKYALISKKGLVDDSLNVALPLYVKASSVDKENLKFNDQNEKYNWKTSNKKMKVRFTNPNSKSKKAYYSPSEINLDFNLNSMMNKEATNFRQTPSLGEVPLLVVPIVLNGFEDEATTANHEKIEKAFFGKTKSEDELPCSSLSSYYYYSSFKQLKFTGEVTPYFNPTKEGYLGYSNPYNFSLDTPSSLAKDALDWVKKKLNINLDDYDSDNDGYVDGVWLIYMESTDVPLTGNVTAFWPFTSATQNAPGTKENPSLNVYAWAGTSHLYGHHAIPSYVENEGVDPHVLEHETGHMLGLNDYYSYSSSTTADTYYSPLGKLDMMNKDFGDHNPYSKILLGWIKPYIVLGDAEIEIPSSQVQNSVFLLPYDDKTYKTDQFGRIIFNPFDEYLILDYYSCENLYSDSFEHNNFIYSFPSEEGGRLYHIDARLLSYDNGTFALPNDPDEVLTSNGLYYKGITNTQSGDRAESAYNIDGLSNYFDEVRWISKNNKKINGNNSPSNSSLFSEGDSFALSSYEEQFVDGKLDSKKAFSTSFEILSIK